MTAAFDPSPSDPSDRGLLSPVWANPALSGETGDAALVAAMLELEAAWAETLEAAELAEAGAGDAVRQGTTAGAYDGGAFATWRLAAAAQGGGNPVIPLVKALREATPEPGRAAVHRGLTSQDVLDSALMLVARRAVVGILADLAAAADALAGLAAQHRTSPQVARTLAQHSLPSSFGLKAANWLQGVAHAEARLAGLTFPIQCGGAAGTNASLVALGGEPAALAADWAHRVGLDAAVAPWQSFRGPVTDLGHALAAACSAAGHVANDVMLLSRPEIGELGEPLAAGRGVSSAMPQKQNPALSALIRSAALRAPADAMQLELASALSEDERTGGAWHSEWPALRELLRLAAGSAAALRELTEGLRVFPERMRANLELSGPLLVSERLMLELSGVAEGGRAGIQKAVDAALAAAVGVADPADQARALRKALRAVVPYIAADDARLDDLLDPAGYQGDAAGIVDRVLADYEERAAGRRTQHNRK
ncbi:lyase family protein [Sinomonas sp. JGH33]|uniref:Lyase family protein n=1 Tax=Sinomonas terricola TaxID=3110330 RepID=A0ABU5T8C6_9MICC|nr:lyase family protein [Sinomonas sp. JGH33]MEA5455944.1 lyase family protein [Sinomonas sp. JGH33]